MVPPTGNHCNLPLTETSGIAEVQLMMDLSSQFKCTSFHIQGRDWRITVDKTGHYG